MPLDPSSRARFNLEEATVLLVDDTTVGMSILVQIIKGLGCKTFYRCADVEQAYEVAGSKQIDLAIVDALAPSGLGYDFVRWLRRRAGEPNCYTPVILTTGHTPPADVARARDCGANIIVKKPIAPITMLERILWVSKEGRPYLSSETYVGPDRRFQNWGPPEGVGRRKEDRAAAEAAAAEAQAGGTEPQPDSAA